MGMDMDIVERVARAMLVAKYERYSAADEILCEHASELEKAMAAETRLLARAALAAMLEAAGEPVAWQYDNPEFNPLVGRARLTQEDCDNDWTETPLYSLAALREAA